MTPRMISWYLPSISNVAPADALTDMTHVLAEREEFSAAGRHAEKRRGARAQSSVGVADAVEHGRRDDVGDEDGADGRNAQRVRDSAFQLDGRLPHRGGVDPGCLTAREAGLRVFV